MDARSASSWALDSKNMFDLKLDSGKSANNSKVKERGQSIASSFDFDFGSNWWDTDTKSNRDGQRKNLRRSMGHSNSAAQLQQLNQLMSSMNNPGISASPEIYPGIPAFAQIPFSATHPVPDLGLFGNAPPHAPIPMDPAAADGSSQAVLSAMTALQNRIKYLNEQLDKQDRELRDARGEVERWKMKDGLHQQDQEENSSLATALQEELTTTQEQLEITRKELAHVKADKKLVTANYAILEKGNKHQTVNSQELIDQLQQDLAQARMLHDTLENEFSDLQRNMELRAGQLASQKLAEKQNLLDAMQQKMNCHLELVQTQKVLHDSVARLIDENKHLTERVAELERPYSANTRYGTRACGGDLALVRSGHDPKSKKRRRSGSARRATRVRSSSSARSTATRSNPTKRSRSARGGTGTQVRRHLWTSYKRTPPFILGTSAKPSHSAPVNSQVHSRKSPWHTKRKSNRQLRDAMRPRTARARMQSAALPNANRRYHGDLSAPRDAPIRAEIRPAVQLQASPEEKQELAETMDNELRTLRNKYELLLKDTPKHAGFLSEDIKRLIFQLEEKAMELSTMRAAGVV